MNARALSDFDASAAPESVCTRTGDTSTPSELEIGAATDAGSGWPGPPGDGVGLGTAGAGRGCVEATWVQRVRARGRGPG